MRRRDRLHHVAPARQVSLRPQPAVVALSLPPPDFRLPSCAALAPSPLLFSHPFATFFRTPSLQAVALPLSRTYGSVWRLADGVRGRARVLSAVVSGAAGSVVTYFCVLRAQLVAVGLQHNISRRVPSLSAARHGQTHRDPAVGLCAVCGPPARRAHERHRHTHGRHTRARDHVAP